LKGTRVSNGLMTPKSDCILHPVDFLRVHQLFDYLNSYKKSLKTGRNTPENAVYLQNHNTLQGEFCLRTGTNTPEGDYPFSAGTSTSGNPPSSVWWVRRASAYSFRPL
jgi:hypothetical protein